jgi:hypothetical protein
MRYGTFYGAFALAAWLDIWFNTEDGVRPDPGLDRSLRPVAKRFNETIRPGSDDLTLDGSMLDR